MYLLSLFVIFQFGRLQWILQRTPLPRHIILSRKCSKLPQRFVNFIWIASYSTFSVAQLAIKSVWHLDACKKSKNIKKYDVAQPLSLWFLRWPFNRVHPRISRLNMKALTWRFWCVKRLSKTTLPHFTAYFQQRSQSMIRQGRITVRTPPSDGMIGRVHSCSKIISVLKETPFSPSRKAFWKNIFAVIF